MRVEIVSTEVKSRTVVSKRDGKQYIFYTQEAYLHDGSAYPTRCFVPVADAASAYSVGLYRLAPSALAIDRFGNLALRRRFGLVSDEV